MCPLTLHALLHVPDDILTNGPCCYNWTFVMERWCGTLVAAVKSRVKPFVLIALQMLHQAQLSVIQARYNLSAVLSLSPPSEMLQEVCYDECEYLDLSPLLHI